MCLEELQCMFLGIEPITNIGKTGPIRAWLLNHKDDAKRKRKRWDFTWYHEQMFFTLTSLKDKCICNLHSSRRQFAFKPTINDMYFFVYFMTLNFIAQLWGFHQPLLLIALIFCLNWLNIIFDVGKCVLTLIWIFVDRDYIDRQRDSIHDRYLAQQTKKLCELLLRDKTIVSLRNR